MRGRGAPWFALVLIALGVFFLLRETGVISNDVAVGPLVLIAAGALLLILALTIAVGVGLLLSGAAGGFRWGRRGTAARGREVRSHRPLAGDVQGWCSGSGEAGATTA
jgi:hypothetical protein